jgi:NADPH2:quinone reductase
MARMKAAVIYENGGPEVLRYEEVPDPDCPDGCVVVDAEAISVEGGDLLARAAGDLPAAPHIAGYLSAGTVSEVAAGVEGRAVGDRVVALNAAGSHAARRAVPAAMTWPAEVNANRFARLCGGIVTLEPGSKPRRRRPGGARLLIPAGLSR